jgi:tetratricopeptide (TPR) repeat protein
MKPKFWMILIGCLLLATTAAGEKSKRAQARDLAQAGVSAYDLGQFDKALGLFTQAYVAFPDPDILYSVAQTQRKLGAYEQAIEAYRAYLRNRPDASDKKEILEQIDELTRLIASQKANREKPPEGTRLPPQPDSKVPLVPTTPEPVTDRPTARRPWYKDYVAWTLVGSGVAVAGVSTALLVSASSSESDLGTITEGNRGSERDSIRTQRTIGTIGLGVGGALVAGGIIKFALTNVETEGPSTELLVGPSSIAVFGRF